jgi:translocation and assembly module TamB
VVTLGSVDRLLPKASGEPFSFPELDVSVSDARMRLDTEFGPVGIRLSGRGNLATNFAGQIAVAAPRFENANCTLSGATLFGNFQVSARQPNFKGPVRIKQFDCAGVHAAQASLTLNAKINEAVTRWSGDGAITSVSASGQGAQAAGLSGTFDFDGAEAVTRGNVSLGAQKLTAASFEARAGSIGGTFDLRSNRAFEMSGALQLNDVVPHRALLARANGLSTSASGSPAAPLARALGKAFSSLERGGDVTARYAAVQADGQSHVTLSAINAVSRSGARLAVMGESPIRWRRPGGFEFAGRARLSGGGFPVTDIHFDGLGGMAQIAPYSNGGARLVTTPVRFSVADGLRVDTIATIDGPLGSGRVTGLRVPLSIRPGRAALGGCIPAFFERLEISGLRLLRSNLTACISGDEARIAAPRLEGRLGASSIQLAARTARVGLSRGDFAVDALAVRLGNRSRLSLLDVAQLSGTFRNGAAQGRFDRSAGQIGNVPLKLSQGAGTWKFADGVFALSGGLQLADAAVQPRFSPLISDDVSLRLANGKIIATGTAREPKNHALITNITISHDLDRGIGSAVLDVPGISFGPALQPEELTNITLGVIANVEGEVRGKGVINWTPQAVTSTGGFRTDNLNLAAAFGPVTGLRGEITLSDLLGLETGPGQRVSIASINPGIAVNDGVLAYRLLPGLKVQIEGGRWPFAGGALILEPTTFDLSESAERRLTFRVEGLDAARFIAALEFQNIAATGQFDGTLPMIFDKNGGRIEGGQLTARGGGTLAYVGEISNENLGMMGQIAFDALKSIKYNRLTIELGGAIDGDVVTRVKFAGVNQAPISGVRTKLPIKIVGLTNVPFIFNVTITAPFRQLFETARSINDPTLLIQRMLPQLQPPAQPKPKDLPKPDTPVQQ